MRKLTDSLAFWVILCIVVLLFCFGLIVYGQGKHNEMRAAHKEIFYSECLKDHKRYECDVLWQQAQPPKKQRSPIYFKLPGNPIVMPM